MDRKIVLDTNVLIMSISVHSPYFQIWESFLHGDFILCVSNDIIEEYAEILARNISPRFSNSIIHAILLRPNVKRVDPHYSFHLINSDVDDNKFVDCAIVSNAELIVTEDRHFAVLDKIPFPKVYHLSIDDFTKLCISHKS